MEQPVTALTSLSAPTTVDTSVTDAAKVVIGILHAAGWTIDEIIAYNDEPKPGGDRGFELEQVATHGAVRIGAAEMRAEIRRLLHQ